MATLAESLSPFFVFFLFCKHNSTTHHRADKDHIINSKKNTSALLVRNRGRSKNNNSSLQERNKRLALVQGTSREIQFILHQITLLVTIHVIAVCGTNLYNSLKLIPQRCSIYLHCTDRWTKYTRSCPFPSSAPTCPSSA